ncbi:MAG: leucine-rich repeat protein [Candidatus Saccharibacteria bacterium]
MKKIYLLFAVLCLFTGLQAQVSKTVEVTAGRLDSLLSATEHGTVTDLTLTGTLDARDFKTMRDLMPLLENVDLAGAVIAEYDGRDGTACITSDDSIFYAADEIPMNALCKVYFPGYFKNDKKFKSIVLPLSIKSIGEKAFINSCGLTSLEIPQGVTSIGAYAFCACLGLRNIVLPSSLEAIEPYAFSRCISLESIDLPSAVTTIEEALFMGCTSLSAITLSSSITNIKEQAFSGCTALTSVTIPASVTNIGFMAFYWCTGLESVILPASTMLYGDFAFGRCTGLQSIYAQSPTPVELLLYGVFDGVDKDNCKLYVPPGSRELYAQANQWQDFKNILEMTTGIEQTEQDKALFHCYPNPFTSETTIEIQNPSLKEVTVEIFSVSGQKIQSLVQAQKGAKINCKWNGRNESGQKMPGGVYLLKVNGETRKVVKN